MLGVGGETKQKKPGFLTESRAATDVQYHLSLTQETYIFSNIYMEGTEIFSNLIYGSIALVWQIKHMTQV